MSERKLKHKTQMEKKKIAMMQTMINKVMKKMSFKISETIKYRIPP